jgi:hypothetical protein
MCPSCNFLSQGFIMWKMLFLKNRDSQVTFGLLVKLNGSHKTHQILNLVEYISCNTKKDMMTRLYPKTFDRKMAIKSNSKLKFISILI